MKFYKGCIIKLKRPTIGITHHLVTRSVINVYYLKPLGTEVRIFGRMPKYIIDDKFELVTDIFNGSI